ncbi:MAG: HAMP domain-containing protein [Magnetococcales bacterium]|nr:HAMP domain-containing protein [Magnetococcales bacterium]
MFSSLKAKTFTALLVITLVLGIVLTIASMMEARNTVLDHTRQFINSFEQIVQTEVAAKSHDLAMSVELLLNDKEVVTAFAQSNREKLSQHTLPIFKSRLKPDFNIRQFQFHLPPATSFFRVHKPQKFDDDLSAFRKTVVTTNRDKKPVIGIEVGRAGPGLRVVYPVSKDNKHIGSVEFGGSLKAILDTAQSITDTQFAIGIYQEVFKAARRFQNKESDLVDGELVFYTFSDEHLSTMMRHGLPTDGSLIDLDNGQYLVGTAFFLTDYSGQKIGEVRVFKDISDTIHDLQTSLWLRIGINLILSIVISVIIFLLFNKMVLRPIKKAVEFSQKLAQGDLTAQIDTDRRDEIGALMYAMNTMAENLKEMIQNIIDRAARVATNAENLNNVVTGLNNGSEILSDRAQTVADNTEQMQNNIQAIASSSQQLNSSIDAVTEASEMMNMNMTTISAAAEEASINLTTVAAATEEVSANVSHVRESAQRSSGNINSVASAVEQMTTSLQAVRAKCETASTETQKADTHAAQAMTVIKQLTKSASEIGQVVDTINNIAEQTNMLALNASIEAAGAGEAGKGFAVVANEVKDLARQTGEATQTISQQVSTIQNNTNEVAETIEEVSRIVGVTREANDDILYSVDEQNTTMSEIANAMSDASSETGEVSRLAEESNHAVEEVSRNAQEISSGIQEVTRNVADAATGAQAMSATVSEASQASNSIVEQISESDHAAHAVSESMLGVNRAVEHLDQLSKTVHEQAESLKDVAAHLNADLSRFQL